jgi:hypothetical protein
VQQHYDVTIASPRSSHTAPSLSNDFDSLVVTHPFHPLTGRRLSVVCERRYKSALGRVYICDGGTLGNLTLPESFTDRGMPAARRALTADVLADLSATVSALRSRLTCLVGSTSLVSK